MKRITKADLEAIVNEMNDGQPPIVDGKWVPGRYTLSYAYGGVDLHRIVNEGGGIRALLNRHVPKRELWERIRFGGVEF